MVDWNASMSASYSLIQLSVTVGNGDWRLHFLWYQ